MKKGNIDSIRVNTSDKFDSKTRNEMLNYYIELQKQKLTCNKKIFDKQFEIDRYRNEKQINGQMNLEYDVNYNEKRNYSQSIQDNELSTVLSKLDKTEKALKIDESTMESGYLELERILKFKTKSIDSKLRIYIAGIQEKRRVLKLLRKTEKNVTNKDPRVVEAVKIERCIMERKINFECVIQSTEKFLTNISGHKITLRLPD